MSAMRETFDKEYADKDSLEIQKELLYQAFRSNSMLDKTNRNVKGLYTWLVVVPIVIGIIIFIVMPILINAR